MTCFDENATFRKSKLHLQWVNNIEGVDKPVSAVNNKCAKNVSDIKKSWGIFVGDRKSWKTISYLYLTFLLYEYHYKNRRKEEVNNRALRDRTTETIQENAWLKSTNRPSHTLCDHSNSNDSLVLHREIGCKTDHITECR